MNQEPEKIDPLHAGKVIPQPGKPSRQNMIQRSTGNPVLQVPNRDILELIRGRFKIRNNPPIVFLIEPVVGNADVVCEQDDASKQERGDE